MDSDQVLRVFESQARSYTSPYISSLGTKPLVTQPLGHELGP